jgi:hypothetical protein
VRDLEIKLYWDRFCAECFAFPVTYRLISANPVYQQWPHLRPNFQSHPIKKMSWQVWSCIDSHWLRIVSSYETFVKVVMDLQVLLNARKFFSSSATINYSRRNFISFVPCIVTIITHKHHNMHTVYIFIYIISLHDSFVTCVKWKTCW